MREFVPQSCPLHLPQNWPAGGFFKSYIDLAAVQLLANDTLPDGDDERHRMTLTVTDAYRPVRQTKFPCFLFRVAMQRELRGFLFITQNLDFLP